jgi:hypothetical protein
VCLDSRRAALPHAQYNIGVTGITKAGQRERGLPLQGRQPQVATPSGGLRLTEARATGSTSGTAAAAAPAGTFTKVPPQPQPSRLVRPLLAAAQGPPSLHTHPQTSCAPTAV